MKRRLLLVIAFLAFSCTPVLADADLQNDFPNEEFRAIVAQFDTNGDGTLSDAEIAEIKEIDCQKNQSVDDLTGIEHLTALESLSCWECPVSTLNLANNPMLNYLDCCETKLASLDVTGNPGLRQLYAYGNSFTALDLSKCPYLVTAAGNGVYNKNVNGGTAYSFADEETSAYLCIDKKVTADLGNGRMITPPGDGSDPAIDPGDGNQSGGDDQSDGDNLPDGTAVFLSPENGKTFSGPSTVQIALTSGDYVECDENTNYCEITVYSRARNGLKVLEQTFPYTTKGQTIATSFYASDIGDYQVFASFYHKVNGFKNYHARDSYVLWRDTPEIIWASAYTSFTVTDDTPSGGGSDTPSGGGSDTPAAPVAIKPAIKLSKTSYTWNNKVQTPAVTVKYGSTVLKNGTDYTLNIPKGRKNIGTYTFTVTMKGKYSGRGTASYTIVPKGTSLSSVKAAKKAATVKWKKQTAKMPKAQITGYQVQYSLNKSFRSGNKIKTIKGAKKTSVKLGSLASKKVYYVRVRTYMKTGSKTYYSGWSGIKSVKVK